MDENCVNRGDSVAIVGGKYAGLVGSVTTKTDAGAWVYFAGNFEGEQIDKEVFFKFSMLGGING